ncbi:MAG TPA: polysaccharide deacetylase family protein [Candidatus Limnocylindrales bacterium]|jgi:peptidoglycan/xylan/chitin deacetylase (PgdA/CDA1 family)
MTTSTRGLGSPAVTLSLAAFLVSLVVLATATGLVSFPGGGHPPSSNRPSAVAAVPTPTLEPTLGYPSPTPAPTFMTYRVAVGDTLSSIARQFGTTPRSLSWWNRGTYPSLDPESPAYDPNAIKPGWTLVLLPGTTVDDENPPSPSPAPPSASPLPSAAAPSGVPPTASPQPSASSTAVVPANVITHGSLTSSQVALTLDMGGRLDPAVDIMNWLIAHQVHATIFPTGAAGTTTTQGETVLALAKAHPELFDVGNHSWSHPDFTTLTAGQMAQQITSTEAAVAPLVGTTTKPWFRPPYGAWNDAVRYGVAAAGWRHIVMWDIDTIDWKPESDGGPTTATIVAKIQANAQGGSIVLMHLGGYHTLDALPGILAALQAKSLQPVTLGEMFGQ